MSVNLIEMAKGLFANEVARSAASALNENESNVSKAFGGLVPSIFSALIDKSKSPDGLDTISRLANEQSSNGMFDNLTSLLGSGDNSSWFSRGSGLVSTLFGNKVDGIVNLISNFAGIKSSSSSSLLSLAVPAILSFLGKYMRTNNLNASGLGSLLSSQSSNISSAIPAGLSLASLFGGTHDTHRTTTTAHTTGHTTRYEETEDRGGGSKWLWPLLLFALLGGLALYMWKGCNKTEEHPVGTDTTTVVTTPTVDTTVTTTTTTTRTLTEVVLPNGVKLQAYPGGIEDQLVKFIQSDEYKNANNDKLKDTWFNFDDLNFEFGTTTLTPESKRQLDNITAILKAFPGVKIKVGGYTDKKGDDAANKKLSDDRAKAVQAALKAAGVGAQVPEAEGYGEQFATVDENASDEARLVDRKTSVRLIK